MKTNEFNQHELLSKVHLVLIQDIKPGKQTRKAMDGQLLYSLCPFREKLEHFVGREPSMDIVVHPENGHENAIALEARLAEMSFWLVVLHSIMNIPIFRILVFHLNFAAILPNRLLQRLDECSKCCWFILPSSQQADDKLSRVNECLLESLCMLSNIGSPDDVDASGLHMKRLRHIAKLHGRLPPLADATALKPLALDPLAFYF
mmetsp:Transcript_32767/g.59900  ORF Transcript_32767/g.59900 Transcript_32767/m.59900 type:complete len:204 (-) Transcript_32767:11-622(-)